MDEDDTKPGLGSIIVMVLLVAILAVAVFRLPVDAWWHQFQTTVMNQIHTHVGIVPGSSRLR